jgi:hypothetical protein
MRSSEGNLESEEETGFHYSQIEPFTNANDSYPGVPTPSSLPFRSPTGADATDILLIVSCARKAVAERGYPQSKDVSPTNIKVVADSTYEITFGHGSGVMIRCQKKDELFQAQGPASRWASP